MRLMAGLMPCMIQNQVMVAGQLVSATDMPTIEASLLGVINQVGLVLFFMLAEAFITHHTTTMDGITYPIRAQ